MKGYVLNGSFRRGDRLEIEFHQPYFAHAHGLFETTRAVRGKAAFLAQHCARMRQGAAEIGMSLPYDDAEIARQTALLLAELGLEDARIKLHLLARHQGADFLITAEGLPPYQELGDEASITEAAGRFARTLDMAGLKTLNYLANRLVEAEAASRGYQEAVFVTEAGHLAEGSRSNLFFARAGTLHTPSLELPILPGITRQVLIDLARGDGIEVVEDRFGWTEIEAADEAFLTGSVGGLRPIRRVRERALAGCPGPLTRRLAALYGRVMTAGLW
ncbi:MAG: aminotransferase class IV [Planctomycetes bacterium]|nr:aminotransferase class IV [Planctomycetota bacterium]